METLSEELAEVLRTPCAGQSELEIMTQEEVVVVHSQGMARWLGMELSKHLGICANITFPFPKAMVRQSVGAVLGEQRDAWKVWRPDAMLWGTLSALDEHIDHPSFAPLNAYLAERSDSGEARDALGHVDAVLLARELADIFDRYISYRPRLIAEWDQGGGDPRDWQPRLWRGLKARTKTRHLGAMVDELKGALSAGSVVSPEALPRRLCLFGISTLPPFYLELFAAMSRIRELHLFILCPSNLYWGDIRAKGERAALLRAAERKTGKPANLAELHLDEGNPLLASFGRLGRDFQVVLESQDSATPYEDVGDALFIDPIAESQSLLHTLQSDILNVRTRAVDGDVPPITLDPEDSSLRVHACYGAMRQVEALRDDLLERLARDPSLEPRDIVVMTPDVEGFAPIVEAVFGDSGADPQLPYRIADRSVASENPIAEVLERILSLTTRRITGAELLDLFAMTPVRERFGLHEEDIATIKAWIQESGIRWGVDAEGRESHGQPAYELNTWRFGLDRMLLGAAMPSEGQHAFMGVLAYDEIEGGDAETLGRLAEACEALFSLLDALQRARPIDAWVETLKGALEAMTQVKDIDAWRVQQVHAALDELKEDAARGGTTLDLDRAAIAALLKRRLDSPARAAGFLTGAVTVCAMVPMRSVPFRVVALIGMDEDTYPRKASGLGFDKTWRHPRIGDRNPREEDRYLMLEAILAARDALIVTYQGRDPQSGEEKAPAAPIDELLEVIADSAGLDESRSPVLLHHPLHAFSPSLFGVVSAYDQRGERIRRETPPRSYDTRRLNAARQMLQEPIQPPSLVRGALALEKRAEDHEEVRLSALIDFFKNPSKGLLHRRLGVYLEDDEGGLLDREPTQIDAGLEAWALRNKALKAGLDGVSEEEVYERLRLSGALPLGVPGKIAFEQASAAVPWLVAEHRARTSGEARAMSIDVMLEGARLVGQVDAIYPEGRVVAQASGMSAKHEVGLWLTHLALRAAEGEPPMGSTLIRRSGEGADVLELGKALSPARARAILSAIIDDYRRGQRHPLRFFPETSKAYVDGLKSHDPDKHKGISPEAHALKMAQKTWEKDIPGAEGQDRYNLALHGDHDPYAPDYTMAGLSDELAPSFSELAERFWSDLFDEVVKEEGA